LDEEEKGDHVRAGYTLASYRSLLEPIGFEIVESEGMGGAALAGAWLLVMRPRSRFGNKLFSLLSFFALPFVWFDPTQLACPYSLYVRAVKRNPPIREQKSS
jgi:hypothetical protein